MSTRRRTPARPHVTREMVNPKTGEVHTLVYEQTPTRHVVRHEPPFGYPERGGIVWAAEVEDARRAWRRLESHLTRRFGLVPVPTAN